MNETIDKFYYIEEQFCKYDGPIFESQVVGIYSDREIAKNEIRHIVSKLSDWNKERMGFDRATPKGDLNNVRFQTEDGFVIYEIRELTINAPAVKELLGYNL